MASSDSSHNANHMAVDPDQPIKKKSVSLLSLFAAYEHYTKLSQASRTMFEGLNDFKRNPSNPNSTAARDAQAATVTPSTSWIGSMWNNWTKGAPK